VFKFFKSLGTKIAKTAKSVGSKAKHIGSRVGNGIVGGAKATGRAVVKAATVTGHAIGTAASATGTAIVTAVKVTGHAIAVAAVATGHAVVTAAVVTGNAIVTAAVVTGKAIKHAAIVTGNAIVTAAVVTGNAIKHAAIVTGNAIAKAAVVTGKAIAKAAIAVYTPVKKATIVAGKAIARAAVATGKALKIGSTATGKGLAIAAKATGRFLSSPLGLSTTLIGALTVTSTVMLASNLTNFVRRDEREIALKSDFDTEFELFSVNYVNESGDILVAGADGEKVIAPGTSVEYMFRLRNTEKIALDYRLSPNFAWTSEHRFPIVFRMIGADGYYAIGDAKSWETVDDIGKRTEFGTLKTGETAEFIFIWKWDYEGDDLLDTELGNLAMTENIGVSVGFTLEAEANTEIENNGGIQGSGVGDIIYTGAMVSVSAAAATILIVTMVKKRKRKI